MSQYLRHFGKVSDWFDYAKNDLPEHEQQGASSYHARKAWNGVDSRAEAMSLFWNGDSAGRERMASILAGIRNLVKLQCPTYEFEPAVEGTAPNVDAFIHGEPEDMFALVCEEKDQLPPALNVQLELCFNAGIQPFQAMWAGATVYAAVEALRAQGCAVTMTMTHTVKNFNGDYWQASVPVDVNTDPDTLAFLLAHPACLRVLVFSMMEQEDPQIRNDFSFRHGGGYSRPSTLKHPSADLCLQMRNLCLLFGYNDEANLSTAHKTMQLLVDTKFKHLAS